MATTALLTLMEAEFQNHLAPGTSVQEKGLRVSIKPFKDEIIHFYHTDNESVRDKLSMSKNERMSCDHVVLLLKRHGNRELLCFLELKGSDVDYAAQQIRNTYKYMNSFWKDRLERGRHQYVIQCAFICLHGRGPYLKDLIRAKELLKPFFDSDEYIDVKRVNGHYTELGQFLRKLYVK